MFLSISRALLGSTVRESIRKFVQVPNLIKSPDTDGRVIVDIVSSALEEIQSFTQCF